MTVTRLYDAAEYLESPEDMAAYLEAALEDGDPALEAEALRTITRAAKWRSSAGPAPAT